jgi:uncharacterized protein YqeY
MQNVQSSMKAELITAMKARDALRVSVIRNIMSVFITESVNKGRGPAGELSDEEALAVIRRLVKQRKDSAEQFIAGGRPELAETEDTERAVLETFLPAQASREDIEAKAKVIVAESGMDVSKAGILVGKVMKEFGGTADGTLVKEIVEGLLKG